MNTKLLSTKAAVCSFHYQCVWHCVGERFADVNVVNGVRCIVAPHSGTGTGIGLRAYICNPSHVKAIVQCLINVFFHDKTAYFRVAF